EAGGPRVRGWRKDRHAQGRAHRRGIPGDRRRLRSHALRRSQEPGAGSQEEAHFDQGDSVTRKIQAIRGMEDVLPDQSALWEQLEEACRDVFRQYGYRNIRVPIVEY